MRTEVDSEGGEVNAEECAALVVMVTAGSRAEAERLAGMIVERRLAACVQVLPEMLSVYRWQGAVESNHEHLLLIKTTRNRFDELERAIRNAHSYDTPEIIAIPAAVVSEPYLNWLRANVSN